MDEISRRNSAAELVGTRLVGRELGEGLDLDGIDARGVAASHAPAGLAAISSRQGLWIAEMDKDDGPFLSKAKCQDKNVKLLDLGSVSWSPPSGRPGCLAAVNKRCVLLWDAEKSEVCGNFESGGGQRSLTDLHWEHVLVTGGMDGSVSIHDPRQLTKVAATFQAKAFGHMQVRCSRLNPSLIAGANAGTVLVWDIRAGNRPLHSIMAHVSNKIGTVDWHPRKAEELMTCSPTEPDVKVWSLQASNADGADSERVVKLAGVAHGVSSVLYLPSGLAIVTSHPDSKLRLSALTTAIQVGSAIADDVVVDRRMDWVTEEGIAGEEDKAVLLTAGGGPHGRLQWWLLAPQLVQPVHSISDRPPDSPEARPEPLKEGGEGAAAEEGWSWEEELEAVEEMARESDVHVTRSFHHEVDLRIGERQYPGVHVRLLLRNQRPLSVVAVLAPRGARFRHTRTHIAKMLELEGSNLRVRVAGAAKAWREAEALLHEMDTDSGSDGWDADPADAIPLQLSSPHYQTLHDPAPLLQGPEGKREGLHALHQLMAHFHALALESPTPAHSGDVRGSQREPGGAPGEISIFGRAQNVPPARTSGGVLSATGVLWLYGEAARRSDRPGGGSEEVGSLTQERQPSLLKSNTFGEGGKKGGSGAVVQSLKGRGIGACDLALARKCKIKFELRPRPGAQSFVAVCKNNADAAVAAGREEVAQSWRLAAHSPLNSPSPSHWNADPLGQGLLLLLLEHHCALQDLQTVSLLLAVFNKAVEAVASKPPAGRQGEGRGQQMRASFVGANNKGRLEDAIKRLVTPSTVAPQPHSSHARAPRYRFSVDWLAWALRTFSETLFAWQLHSLRAHLIWAFPQLAGAKGQSVGWVEQWAVALRGGVRVKESLLHAAAAAGANSSSADKASASVGSAAPTGPQQARDGRHVGGHVPPSGEAEASSRKANSKAIRSEVRCSVCRMVVRSLAATCAKCGHGGHVAHLRTWFAKYSKCPTGCGCQCFQSVT